MQTHVPRISILYAVDLAEHSRVSGEPPCFPEDSDILFLLVVLLGCCGVCPNIHLSMLEAS
uniref:Late blight resistance protein n=1 Tax=Solanum tuberosum TaxID=4113 RepID=M1BR32_SOLTU